MELVAFSHFDVAESNNNCSRLDNMSKHFTYSYYVALLRCVHSVYALIVSEKWLQHHVIHTLFTATHCADDTSAFSCMLLLSSHNTLSGAGNFNTAAVAAGRFS